MQYFKNCFLPIMKTVKKLTCLHRIGNSYIYYFISGNKTDDKSSRCISKEEAEEVSFDMGVSFYETSTRLAHSTHVTNIFHDLVRQIRCVRLRQEVDKKRTFLSPPKLPNLDFTKNIGGRLSFRTKKYVYKRKLSN